MIRKASGHLRVVELAALDSRATSEAHLMSVLMDELRAAPLRPLALPLPLIRGPWQPQRTCWKIRLTA